VQKISGAFNGVVVAQVVTRDKHPNADSFPSAASTTARANARCLRRAEFKAGDKVSLILPGASLPLKPRQRAVHHQGRQIRGVNRTG